ncbi:MAG TPA: WbqC family protein [bacterium]|nr:WbqC family protein [bacterium]
MRLAIMQPYLFPYIGYFQLINAVDKFVVCDDVSFIKQGWINRNRILFRGRDYMFSVPLADASSHRKIKDTIIHHEQHVAFKENLPKTLHQAYGKAPFNGVVRELVLRVLDSEGVSISRLAVNSLKSVCSYLGLQTPFVDTSAVYQNDHLRAQDRVLDICRREGASAYVNAPGGTKLYQKDVFANRGIELLFLQPKPISYRQYDNEFVPWLSIIDVLMFNSVEKVKLMLREYDLQ